MAGFLTPEWAVELTSVLEANAAFRAAAGDADLTVCYDVRGGPEGDVTWVLRLSAHTPSVSVVTNADAPPAPADVTLTLPWDVAVALASGRTTLRRAEAEGSLGITGDPAALYRHSAALTCFDQLQADLDVTFG